MTTARRRRAVGAHSEAARWKARHDALLDVLAAILYAKGDGPQKRLAIADGYYLGMPRRKVAVERLPGRIVVYLEPPSVAPGDDVERLLPPSDPEEEPHGTGNTDRDPAG